MAESVTVTRSAVATNHRSARVDLAVACRWFARLEMHEAVANHLSVAVSADGSQFLINPRSRHFSQVTASNLLPLDANEKATLKRVDAPDPAAWYLHARLHARLPSARCVMHLHSKYSTALGCLKDSTLVSD
jgi:ribulose-5-phosphate 4-epimerase/fuculose-1-phosphate aldolase